MGNMNLTLVNLDRMNVLTINGFNSRRHHAHANPSSFLSHGIAAAPYIPLSIRCVY
jgi:exoribonuclease II